MKTYTIIPTHFVELEPGDRLPGLLDSNKSLLICLHCGWSVSFNALDQKEKDTVMAQAETHAEGKIIGSFATTVFPVIYISYLEKTINELKNKIETDELKNNNSEREKMLARLKALPWALQKVRNEWEEHVAQSEKIDFYGTVLIKDCLFPELRKMLTHTNLNYTCTVCNQKMSFDPTDSQDSELAVYQAREHAKLHRNIPLSTFNSNSPPHPVSIPAWNTKPLLYWLTDNRRYWNKKERMEVLNWTKLNDKAQESLSEISATNPVTVKSLEKGVSHRSLGDIKENKGAQQVENVERIGKTTGKPPSKGVESRTRRNGIWLAIAATCIFLIGIFVILSIVYPDKSANSNKYTPNDIISLIMRKTNALSGAKQLMSAEYDGSGIWFVTYGFEDLWNYSVYKDNEGQIVTTRHYEVWIYDEGSGQLQEPNFMTPQEMYQLRGKLPQYDVRGGLPIVK